MKNIHVLPTNKPSRISDCHDGKLYLDDVRYLKSYQNIYITNDEEINQNTKPCWCLNTIKKTWNDDVVYYQGSMPQYHYIGFKKIILTTDPDLIKDGVQAIDDEFLEWFVKNTSCEEVEVKKSWFSDSSSLDGKYKIIIPKEELKQDLKKYPLTPDECYKQETLEEAAEIFVRNRFAKQISGTESYPDIYASKESIVESHILFTKWQQQQNKNLYSEDDVPTKPEPVLAKISDINCLGKSEWLEVVYYDDKWNSYAGSKTFQNGEKVVNWKYCSEIFN